MSIASERSFSIIFPYLRFTKTRVMTNFLRLISVAILFMCPTVSFAQWTQLTTGTNNDIYCVRYDASGDVWAGSWNGVFRSSNSGATFNFVNGLNSTLGNSQIIGSFDDIHVTGPSSAVAAGFFNLGNDLIIFGTSNNAASWSHNFYAGTGALPRSISAMDFDGAGNGVAVGGAGRVYRSSNNGSTWTAATSGTTNTLEDVSWVNGSTFVSVSGSNIYRSTNNGANWTSVVSLQSNIDNVSFARGTNTGYAGGSGNLRKSVDGGLTWTALNIPAYTIRTIFAFSPDTVYVGAYDGVYRSVTGGVYWEKFDMPNIKWVNDIYFYDANNGMVAGDSGYVAVTSNGGGLPMPISYFSLPLSYNCEDSVTQPLNLGDPAWSYQWFLNGTLVSTQHSPSITLTPPGSATIMLVASNNGYTDTSSNTFSITPQPVVNPFAVINDTICQNGQGHFRIPNSQPFVNYTLFDGAVQVASMGGNGNTVTLTTATNQSVVKPYRIRAVYNNVCGSDTVEVIDSLWIATPSPNVAAILYRDTICTGDTTYMIIFNSEPGWDYYCSNAQFVKVDGTGGAIGIPVGPITSSVTITVYARFKALNCVKALAGSFPLTLIPASLNLTPGTLQGAVGQPIAMSSTSSGYNTWLWDFGANASPATSTGQTPVAPSFSVAGIDTVILTAKLNNTCTKEIRRPVYVYGNLPVATMDTCLQRLAQSGLTNLITEMHLDDFNNLHVAGYNVSSSNFAFTPNIYRIDSAGNRVFFTTFNSLGNSPGAQGLINGLTTDRLTNTYFTTHYVAANRFDIQGKFIRNRNAIVQFNDKGTFQWAIESPLADFSDMITVDGRVFAIGVNAWNGCQFQTTNGGFNYTPSLNNKGEAFIMEINPAGQVLSFDAFGSAGNGGVTNPAKFRVKYPLVNQFFDYDTLRQNLMARKAVNGDILIAGMLDATSIGQPVYFNSTVMANTLPSGVVNEKSLFISRYNLNTGFTDAVNLMTGNPEFITDFKETSSGHYVLVGRAKNKLVTSAGTFNFPTQNYEYQIAASFSPTGTLDWMIYADSMSFKAISVNNDGTVSVTAYMTTKFLMVDALNNPYNLSPTPSVGSFLLRFDATGALVSGARISNYSSMGTLQDACGNLNTYHFTGNPVQFRMYHTVHSTSGSCGSNCYAGYDPNLLDAALDSVTLNDNTTSGPAARDMNIKVKSKSIVTITNLQVQYRINNDPVQTLSFNGNLQRGDSVVFAVAGYNFNRSYNRIRVWISSVNGNVDDYPQNDTIITSQIICSSPLAGVYSTGCDTCYFDRIQASALTLKNCGVSGPVKIAIESGIYYDQVVVDSIPFASATDSIVWTSASGNPEDVELFMKTDYSYYRNPFYFNRTHYCSVSNLTLRNTSPRTYDAMQADGPAQAVIVLNTTDHIRVLNNRLYGAPKDGVISSNATIIHGGLISEDGIFDGNYFEGGETALLMGTSVAASVGIRITNNVMHQSSGLQLYNLDDVIIHNNKINSTGSSYYASIICLECDTLQITNNQVGSENWADRTLDLSCDCPPANPCLVANNSFGSAPLWLPFAGVRITATNANIIHNSFGHGLEFGGIQNVNFVNNLIRSNSDFAIDMSSFNGFGTFNNNRYQSFGAPINFTYNGNDYNLAAWRTLTGFDAASDSVTAEFTTLTDMHLRSAVSMPGVPWPGIITDIDGDARSLSTPTIGADEYQLNPAIIDVWPGDCDSSKNVDNFDILPIGMYFNRFGTSRPEEDAYSWTAYPSLLWNSSQAGGINLNHVDANGDGWIDADDTLAVIQNYGLSHAAASPDPLRLTVGPDLAVVPVGTVFAAGDTVHLKVMAGDGTLPVDLLSAIGFQVAVPTGLIVPGSFAVSSANNWLCPDSNCIMYRRADEVTGVAAVSLVRLDGDAASAYGEMADVQFVVNAAYTGNPTVTISLSDYRAFDPEVTPIPLSPVDGIIQVTNTSTQEIASFDGLKLYPNPSGGNVQLLFNWKGNPGEVAQIDVLDLTGRLVKKMNPVLLQNGSQQHQFDCSDLKEGLYFISLRAAGEAMTIKLIRR